MYAMLLAPLATALLLGGTAVAEDHGNEPAPPERAADPAEAIRAPEVPDTGVVPGEGPPRWMLPTWTDPVPGVHAGLARVDSPAPDGRPRTNAVVDAKLEAARRAVEASRAAGTLYAGPAPLRRMSDAEKHSLADREVPVPPPASAEAGVVREGE